MVDGKKIIAYRGIQFLLFSDGKYNYLAFIPAYFYENKKDVSKEEYLEFSKKFIGNICQRQANKNYYGYLEKWRKIIFRQNTTICAMYPFYLQNSYKEIGQMVLYCLVPYLVCMVALLRLIRLQKKQSLQICAIVMLGSCICWGMSARILPWLYETSAVGVWIVTFLIFAMFFINEIHYIAEMRKEGKMYGIVA